MSDGMYEDDDLYDKYESQSSGDVAPVVSWKKSDKGDGFTGVLLPARPLDRPDKGYEVRREYKQENKKEGTPAGFTVWPPKNNSEKIKTPVVESEFTTRWPDEDISKARKVSQDHFTFETGLTDGSLISSKTLERMVENEKDPKAETRRRIIEQGKDLTLKIAAALKRVGGRPVPGQTWSIKIADRVANDYGGETTIYDVQIAPPNEDTRALVEKYIAKAKQAAGEAEDAADPNDKYAGATASSQEEPPF